MLHKGPLRDVCQSGNGRGETYPFGTERESLFSKLNTKGRGPSVKKIELFSKFLRPAWSCGRSGGDNLGLRRPESKLKSSNSCKSLRAPLQLGHHLSQLGDSVHIASGPILGGGNL